ncbi:hypothetical protein THRCLA_00659 [Thraustotheca clavata]|uniref:Uncharacterized protein n=1 Tax=Thraustotheca clavata TaxID=74557 RepID=A0A1W0AAJ8_9STRA|nr:hypothetical protein THRCLA_00659 [Thraustotheca clavata]
MGTWTEKLDVGIKAWIDEALKGYRLHQKSQLDDILSQQNFSQARVWEAFRNQDDVNQYFHGILRVFNYLSLHLKDHQNEMKTLIHLYASFGEEEERSMVEMLLTSTRYLSLVGQCFVGLSFFKQRTLVYAMQDTACKVFVEWMHDTASVENVAMNYLVGLPDDNFKLWFRVFLHVPVESKIAWVQRIEYMTNLDCFIPLEQIFECYRKDNDRLVEIALRLLAPSNEEIDAVCYLIPSLPTETNMLLILYIDPSFYLALYRLLNASKSVITSFLEDWVHQLASSNAKSDEMFAMLAFAASYEKKEDLLGLYFDASPETSLNWRKTIFSLSQHHQVLLTDLLLCIPQTTEKSIDVQSVIKFFMLLPTHYLTQLLDMTSIWSSEERIAIATVLTNLDSSCIEPLLVLLPLPTKTRNDLYTIIIEYDNEHPKNFLSTLGVIWQDSKDEIRVREILLLVSTYGIENQSGLFSSVLTSDIAFNQRVFHFLEKPPHKMVSITCLRLLLHLPLTAYDQLILMLQHPRRTALNLLVWTDLLLAVSGVSAATVLSIVQPLNEEAMQTLFNYLHTLNNENDSIIIIDLFLHHPTCDVLLFLELTTGMTYTVLKELNDFITRLDMHRQAMFFPLTINPRRAILSRLIVCCHQLELAVIGDLLTSLQPHSWETRTFIIDQVRMLDDIPVLVQFLNIHKQAKFESSSASTFAQYASLASYCGKTVQLVMIKTLTRLALSEQVALLKLFTTCTIQSTISNNQHTRPLGFWSDDLIAHCCRVLLAHSLNICSEVLHTMEKVPSSYYKDILNACTDMTEEAAFFIHLVRTLTDSKDIDTMCQILFRYGLSSDELTTLTICLQKMLKCFSIPAAIKLLSVIPSLSGFLGYFGRLDRKMLFLLILSEYISVAIPLVALLRILDADDALYLMHSLQTLSSERRQRFEAQLLHEPIPPILSAEQKALYFNIIEGGSSKCAKEDVKETIYVPRANTELNDTPTAWSPIQVQEHTLAHKRTRVQKLGIKSPLKLSSHDNPTKAIEITLLPSMLEEYLPVPVHLRIIPNEQPEEIIVETSKMVKEEPQEKKVVKPKQTINRIRMVQPIHIIEEHENVYLPPLTPPPYTIASPERNSRGLKAGLNTINPTNLQHRQRPNTSPASPFEAIKKDPLLTLWPPTRIRVAKTAEAKERVFNARIRSSMGTGMPKLSRQVSLPSQLRKPTELQD